MQVGYHQEAWTDVEIPVSRCNWCQSLANMWSWSEFEWNWVNLSVWQWWIHTQEFLEWFDIIVSTFRIEIFKEREQDMIWNYSNVEFIEPLKWRVAFQCHQMVDLTEFDYIVQLLDYECNIRRVWYVWWVIFTENNIFESTEETISCFWVESESNEAERGDVVLESSMASIRLSVIKSVSTFHSTKGNWYRKIVFKNPELGWARLRERTEFWKERRDGAEWRPSRASGADGWPSGSPFRRPAPAWWPWTRTWWPDWCRSAASMWSTNGRLSTPGNRPQRRSDASTHTRSPVSCKP